MQNIVRTKINQGKKPKQTNQQTKDINKLFTKKGYTNIQ